MGADLCGYIMVGPEKIDREAIKRAKECVREMSAEAKSALKDGDAALEALQVKPGEGEANKSDARVYFTIMVDEHGAEPRAAAEELASLDADKIVDEFVSMWEDGGYRDLMSRPCPHKEGHRIVVAGDMTWGDGPEDESAWGVADKASNAGLFDVLGIK